MEELYVKMEELIMEGNKACHGCEFYQPPNFCKLLSWNDNRLYTARAKYLAWQGQPCPTMIQEASDRSVSLPMGM